MRSLTLPPDERPIPAGRAHDFRLPAVAAAVARRATIDGLHCLRAHPRFFGIHLELYAHRLVLPVPGGIGVAPPQRRRGVYVLGGVCSYPARTFEPTGVVVVDSAPAVTVGMLFAIWGQPLSSFSLADFRGRVVAFVDGHAVRGPAEAIPLRRHAQIVLEVAGVVPPHPAYRFPPGL